MLIISPKDGFNELSTESVSSKVFVREGLIYKINRRNSHARQASDLKSLLGRLEKFAAHIPASEIVECCYENELYTAVVQPLVRGREIKKLDRMVINQLLANKASASRAFVLELLAFFFHSIEQRELYPDIVGYPADPTFYNSVNLILEEETGRLILCDVGLSPHEDTLRKRGKTFYATDDLKKYARHMREFHELLAGEGTSRPLLK